MKYKVFKEHPIYIPSPDTSTFVIQIRILDSAEGCTIVFDDNLSVDLRIGDMITHLNNDKFVKSDIIRGEVIDMIIGI